MEPNSPIPNDIRVKPNLCDEDDVKNMYQCQDDILKVLLKTPNKDFYLVNEAGEQTNGFEVDYSSLCETILCADTSLCN